ncbi:MAG: AMP-binding protein [Actinomycetota bacterium]|nr:AMP-binding protein [Actinomycetota bacterium]
MGMTPGRSEWTAEDDGTALRDVTIGEVLAERLLEHADREALVFDEPDAGAVVRWTWAELADETDRVARGLVALGVGRGDRVAVLAPNRPEWVVLELALARIGVVLVAVNTAYRAAELSYLLAQGEVQVLVTATGHRGVSFVDAVAELVPELADHHDPAGTDLRAAAFPALRHVVVLDGGGVGVGAGPEPDPPVGMLAYAAMVALGNEVTDRVMAERSATVEPGDVAQIQYTSGTTGRPKGVMLTHRSTINNARLMSARAGFGPDDRMLSAMPFFHTAGCVCNVLSMVSVGGTLIAMTAFDAPTMLRLLDQERATVINGVPTMWIRMLADEAFTAGRIDTTSLHTAFTGGTSIPPALMAEVRDRMGAEPMIIMGMTETSPIITQTLPGDDLELRLTTAGVPLPHTSIRVVDPETGEVTPTGEPGELLIRGYLVTEGYFAMPERTEETIDVDGWLRSGDIATLDERGYLRIVGRAKDMIIRGGENLYPAEIEDLLCGHPAIAQAQVVGVPDPEMGEEAFAFLQLAPGSTVTTDEIRDWCRATFSRHKVPRHLRFVDEYPLTASGKVRKVELRDLARAELG